MKLIFLITAGIVAFVIIKLTVGKKSKAQEFDAAVEHLLGKKTEITSDTNEDTPVGFGFKTRWIAVKTNDLKQTAEILRIKDSTETNWKSGIDQAYKNAVFITPPVDDWILAVGEYLPPGDSVESITEVKSILEKLSERFGEAQFFCTHRVVEYHCWIKALNGKVVRVYSYLGEAGENILIEGEPTDAELIYNLVNTFSDEAREDSYYDREDIDYPDEEIVMQIAEKWSIDPTSLDDRTDINGLGIVGKI